MAGRGKLLLQAAAVGVVASLVALLAITVVRDAKAQSLADKVEAGERPPAPPLELPALNGDGRISLASYRGKAVVLNFWASWCAPCRAEAPTLNEVAQRTAPDGVRFVGINVKDERSPAQAFERRQQVSYPSLHDQPGRLLLQFRRVVPQTPPTTLVLDRQGRIAGFFAGEVRLSELLAPVEQIAAEA